MAGAQNIKTIAIAAGGTGGHLFPAESLARELKNRGFRVELVSDDRVVDFASHFPADAIHQITSGTVTGGGILGKLKGALALGKGFVQCRGLIKKMAPEVIVGFGGYPTVPPILAATLLKIPAILHEQNAVMGRANRFLASRVTAIATGFDIGSAAGSNHDDPIHAKTIHVGNPVRQMVLAAAEMPMPDVTPDGPVHILVFGGSQGARVMSDVVPPAIGLLSANHRKRLHITQQARAEDIERVRSAYYAAGVACDCAPFFKDLPARITRNHLVIARSGASTVAELAAIGRASILVPLPGSLDQDQTANAAVLARDGGALVMMQPDFTPRALADRLGKLMEQPSQLIEMAQKARSTGILDAASRLADLVLKVAENRNLAKPAQ
jgi:UDP-N-acetylglucosamine--N-acetylmuramyl-(pentapeptide) pyrophosphoryl-undecaprenol N-acetylglucosamine transferase